ncbi:MAG: bifunctional 5,10-methylenetetrahydrofolate dehydrogenase/5,10-methenyltetrahydrofolate cyclohydrolase [Candidatus Omnitrophota bacterium]
MALSVDGKTIAENIERSVKERIRPLMDAAGSSPKLVSLIVGGEKEAEIYVKMQKKLADAIGIEFEIRQLKPDIGQDQLAGKIEELNRDRSVTAIILQKPLPEGVGYDSIISKILPEKDAEGIHPYNLGRILRREADIVPCTPGAVMKILSEFEVDLYGKEVVIIGHSAIVGKPLSLMMLNETATTTVCHIGTADKGDLVSHARRADVLVVAVGKPEMVKGDWIKDGAIVIDVGINHVGGKIVGDVDFQEVQEKAFIITPVPGGVGPITVAILMRNVLHAFKKQNS